MKKNWSDYEQYLKPYHLKGKAHTLTIASITEEETHPQGGKARIAPVVWFKEHPFSQWGFVLSPTNRHTLIEIYGDPINDSIGKTITIKSISIGKVAGKEQAPIRISSRRPATASSRPDQEISDQLKAPTIDEPARPDVDRETGEIFDTPTNPTDETTYPEQPERLQVESQSELEQHFGPSQTAEASTWPDTEAKFFEWLKANNVNGKETRMALGTDTRSWLRMNPGKTFADVAKIIAGTFGGTFGK